MAVAMRESVVDALVAKYCGEAEARDPDLVGLIADCVSIFNLDPQLLAGVLAPESRRDVEAMRRRLSDNIGEHLMTKYSVYSPEALNDLCRVVLLEVLDESWRQHFEQMEVLMSGIALRSLGKRDPVTEFRTDAFELFEQMMAAIPEQFCRAFCMPRPKSAADQNALLKSLLGIGDAG